MIDIEQFNALSTEEAVHELLRVCGSHEWARRMSKQRPFLSLQQMIDRGSHIWGDLDPYDWREAFAAHPRIGDKAKLREKFSHGPGWEGDEQKGTSTASEEVLDRLARCNDEYDKKNGFVFLICATGKSAVEMLSALEERLQNSTDEELINAAAEQNKITEIRLRKLIKQQSSRL